MKTNETAAGENFFFKITSTGLLGEAQNILYYLRGPSGQKPHYYLCSGGPEGPRAPGSEAKPA